MQGTHVCVYTHCIHTYMYVHVCVYSAYTNVKFIYNAAVSTAVTVTMKGRESKMIAATRREKILNRINSVHIFDSAGVYALPAVRPPVSATPLTVRQPTVLLCRYLADLRCLRRRCAHVHTP